MTKKEYSNYDVGFVLLSDSFNKNEQSPVLMHNKYKIIILFSMLSIIALLYVSKGYLSLALLFCWWTLIVMTFNNGIKAHRVYLENTFLPRVHGETRKIKPDWKLHGISTVMRKSARSSYIIICLSKGIALSFCCCVACISTIPLYLIIASKQNEMVSLNYREASTLLVVLAILFLFVAIWIVLKYVLVIYRCRSAALSQSCVDCNYCLRSLASVDRCPECGCPDPVLGENLAHPNDRAATP